MKNKVLKNIPKPDEEKLAIFYGQENKIERTQDAPEMSMVDRETTTVDKKMSTVDILPVVNKITPILSDDMLNEKLKSLLTHSQQCVYINLYKRSYAGNQNTTDWIGYGELAKELKISLKTVQRAIDKLIEFSLIKRVDMSNTAQIKGSKYKVFLQLETTTVDKEMATVDNMTTVGKTMSTMDNRADNINNTNKENI